MNISEAPVTWQLHNYFFTDIGDTSIDLRLRDFCAQLEAMVQEESQLATYTPTQWAALFDWQDAVSGGIMPVLIYLSLCQSKDTQNQAITKRVGEIQTVVRQQYQRVLFISEALRQLGSEGPLALAGEPELVGHQKMLRDLATEIKFILPQAQEKVLMEVGDVLGIFGGIYRELTNSFTFEYDGRTLTTAELLTLREDDDPAVRQQAWDLYLAKYGEKANQIVLGNLYKSVCKKNVANMRNRDIPTVMYTRNSSEDMEDSVVDALLDQVSAHYPLYQRFLKKKAALLGKGKLAYYDLFAPLPGVAKKVVPFAEGFAQYAEVMRGFDQQFYDYSLDMLDGGRLDVYPALGKRSGAFAQYSKGVESVVLLNYTDTLGDVMTLAHELGHAIHGHLSQGQSRYTYRSPLCLAETASIFNEQILFDSFFPQLAPEEKTYYTAERLTDIFSTMFRQVMYVRFERRCHEAYQANQELGYEDFNRLWTEESQLLYGDALEVTPAMGCGWSSIPHIFNSPFYCYAYSFGMTLSFALYNLYVTREDRQEFLADYKAILASGGSVAPKELLLGYNIDITQPQFYGNAFALIERMIDQL